MKWVRVVSASLAHVAGREFWWAVLECGHRREAAVGRNGIVTFVGPKLAKPKRLKCYECGGQRVARHS